MRLKNSLWPCELCVSTQPSKSCFIVLLFQRGISKIAFRTWYMIKNHEKELLDKNVFSCLLSVPCPCCHHAEWMVDNRAKSRSRHNQSLARAGTWTFEI